MKGKMASPLPSMFNGSSRCSSEPLSFRRCIGINQELFDLAMSKKEKEFNKICSGNGTIYFCSKTPGSRKGHYSLVLNVMGCDIDGVNAAATELFLILKRVSVIDGLNFIDLPKYVDDVLNRQNSSPRKSEPPSPPSERGSIFSEDGDDVCDGVSSVVHMQNDISINLTCVALVRQEAEAIVCITNSHLQCTEPSSKAVAAAIGGRHKTDVEEHLRAKGPLKPCQVIHADAGNLFLTVRKIIYVAEPNVDEPTRQHCLLEDLYFNCLLVANNEIKVKSISFPFFNSDSCKVASPVVAYAICKALIKFDEQFSESPNSLNVREVNIACAVKKTALIQKTVFDIYQSKMKRYQRDGEPLLQSSLKSLSRNWHSTSGGENEMHERVTKQSVDIVNDESWWKDRITANWVRLEVEISMNTGFEGELMKLEVFTPLALQMAMEETNAPKKVNSLLKHLVQGDEHMFKKFCQALNSSGQQTVVSRYFNRESSSSHARVRVLRSVTDSTIREDLKLLQRWKCENLRKYRNILIARITCDLGLMGNLKSLFVFTDHQMAELEAESSETNRNQLILQWLERGSESTHKKFCTALKNNNQEHLVTNYLHDSGIFVEHF